MYDDLATRRAIGEFLSDISDTTRAAIDVVAAPDPRNTSALREQLARTIVAVDRLSEAVEHRHAA